jgi:hypothetical protein
VHRWDLWRIWDQAKPLRIWVMLNPSTADETDNDPTVERCEIRNITDGFGGLVVLNIFGLCSTDPKQLYTHLDPIGGHNDVVIQYWLSKLSVGQVVCAWGTHGVYRDRGSRVMQLIKVMGLRAHVLKFNKDGTPVHPLYVSYDIKPAAVWK